MLYDALAEHIKVEPEATLHILCSFLSKNTREGGSSFVELRRKIITCLVTRDAKNVVMNDVNSTMASELRDTLLQVSDHNNFKRHPDAGRSLFREYQHQNSRRSFMTCSFHSLTPNAIHTDLSKHFSQSRRPYWHRTLPIPPFFLLKTLSQSRKQHMRFTQRAANRSGNGCSF